MEDVAILEEWVHCATTNSVLFVFDGSKASVAGTKLSCVEWVLVTNSGVGEDNAVEVSSGIIDV